MLVPVEPVVPRQSSDLSSVAREGHDDGLSLSVLQQAESLAASTSALIGPGLREPGTTIIPNGYDVDDIHLVRPKARVSSFLVEDLNEGHNVEHQQQDQESLKTSLTDLQADNVADEKGTALLTEPKIASDPAFSQPESKDQPLPEFTTPNYNPDSNSNPNLVPPSSLLDIPQSQKRPYPPSLASTPSPRVQSTTDNTGPIFFAQPAQPAMIFGDFHKNQAAAHRRRVMATTTAISEYEADLTSKDRMKQRDAIRRVLLGRVKDDWVWEWPQDERPSTPIVGGPGEEREEVTMEGFDAEGGITWVERDEWESNKSETETDAEVKPLANHDPFRFSSPDGVGAAVTQKEEEQKSRRRKRLADEMQSNEGLRCYTHRRNAWTRARHVRNTAARKDSSISHHSTTPFSSSLTAEFYASHTTEIPIAPHILPASTPLRKNITERSYTQIYEKVVLQGSTPFCPINLSVVIRSCVEGWKRDGEWPPKAGPIEPGFSRRKDAIIAEAREPGVGRGFVRRSLQRVMGVVGGPGKRKSV